MPLKLNKEQKAAAEFSDGICVVVAVPGSGKTLTMTHKPIRPIVGLILVHSHSLTLIHVRSLSIIREDL